MPAVRKIIPGLQRSYENGLDPGICLFIGDNKGRPRVKWNGKVQLVSRVVLAWKLGRELALGQQALHTCDNGRCVNPHHLYEGSHNQNMRDRVERGGYRRGSEHPNARWTEDTVRMIKREFREGASMRSLSDKYGVPFSQVQRMVRGNAWKHVS